MPQQREEIVLALREHPLKRLTTITLENDNYTGLVKEVVGQVNGVVLKRVVLGREDVDALCASLRGGRLRSVVMDTVPIGGYVREEAFRECVSGSSVVVVSVKGVCDCSSEGFRDRSPKVSS